MSAEAIYAALTQKKWGEVIDLCSKDKKEGPFLKISLNQDSVLQRALYSGNVKLVMELLDNARTLFKERVEFEEKLVNDLNIKGNTVLHVAATQDACVLAAEKILSYAGHLLLAKNKKGETPIFYAVHYGQLKMFQFLYKETIKMVPDEEIRLLFFYKTSHNYEQSCTILHVAIYNEHFELALWIAQTIPDLISVMDHQQMTGLHMLAMNSTAFRHRYWKWLKHLLPSTFRPFTAEILGQDASDHKVKDGGVESSSTMTIPFWTKFKKEYRGYLAALELGTLLVKKDTKWIARLGTNAESDSSEDDSSGSGSAGNSKNADEESVKPRKPKPPTPLILAIKFGCMEIALQIIKEHPQTVEQVDEEYGSILHLAIKYRRIEIFDEVENMEMQMRRLARLQDKDKNSILHMVALNTTKVKAKNGTDNSILDMLALNTRKVEAAKNVSDAILHMVALNNQKVEADKNVSDAILHMVALNIPKVEADKNVSDETSTNTPKRWPWEAEELNYESRSPAFILQDDLVLFERVEEILKTHYHKIPNKDLETPDQLFAAKKEPLREDAQEWMKRTAENCSLVAVLIATVAFAAAYTVPGGTDDKDGYPRLLDQTFFMVFTVADVLSLASTLTAVVVFLSILCSSYRLKDFKVMLPRSLMFGILCLIFSLTMMMLAFAATIILMIKNRQNWTKIALYAVAFLPVSVLVSTYLPFYLPLMQTVYYTMDKVKLILPEFDDPKKEKIITWFNRLKSSLSKNKESTTSPEPSNKV